ncbi:MAG: KamA family radical SAM protein [Spirochaetaceae bacterium]|nr:MAG: KamA family radical SAM protein [Spirochaetaceae bacterium]
MASQFYTDIRQVPELCESERKELERVTRKYEFKASRYYLSLIDWNDPADPLRQIVIPSLTELSPWGRLDASKESKYTVMPGLQHKYNSTALLLVSDTCACICRYCFRKRIFRADYGEKVRDLEAALGYIAAHPEINNVLLTGGDPLMLAPKKLGAIMERLRGVDHVRIIRIGTKVPAYLPSRIVDNPGFAEAIRRASTSERRVYCIVHFNHERELTDTALTALDVLLQSGAILANQTPLLRGVNDDPLVLANLFNRLSYIGVPPYYVFQCRPTLANKDFAVPVEEGYTIFEEAKSRCSGLAKRARFVMSHETGKIEVVGMTESEVFLKYLRAECDRDSSRFVVMKRNPAAYWYDDYGEPVAEQYLE